MKFRAYKTGDEEFDRVFEYSIKRVGMDLDALSLEEILLQEKYINEHWSDFVADIEEKNKPLNH